MAVATWRRTTSYTGLDPHPLITAKMGPGTKTQNVTTVTNWLREYFGLK